MTRRIDALVAAMTGSGGRGAAVAVAYRGETVYQGCFGLAEVEWRQPVTPDTVFALASLSKPLTAITVVLLACDSLIDLDAAVGDYLPGYAGAGRAALIRHLLTHTSGIPNFLTLPGFRDGAAHLDHTPAQLMEVFAALPLEFEPGARYGYSNSGYRLLDIIIGKVTGAPFDEVITERVFRPAGMTGARLLTDRAVIPWRARGYELATDSGLATARHLSMTITGGAGGLAASLQDMLAFDQAMRGHALISPQNERQMHAPTPLTSGRTEGIRHGLGPDHLPGHAGGQPRRRHRRLLLFLRPLPRARHQPDHPQQPARLSLPAPSPEGHRRDPRPPPPRRAGSLSRPGAHRTGRHVPRHPRRCAAPRNR